MKIIWIDDYPSPIRRMVSDCLRARGVEVLSCFLHKDGSHEGRKWGQESEAVSLDEGWHRVRRDCADARAILVYEATMPLAPQLIRNAPLIRRCKSIVIIGHLDTRGGDGAKGWLRRVYSWLTIRLSSGVLYYSSASEKYIRARDGQPFRIAYGTPLGKGDAVEIAESGLGRKSLEVLFVGVWNDRKAFATFYATARKIEPHLGLSIRFTHAGEIDAAEAIKFPEINFLGHVSSRESLDRVRREMDIGVLPSTREPWGHVVLENLWQGLPTIVTDHCGSADVVRRFAPNLVLKDLSEESVRKVLLDFIQMPNTERVKMAREGQRLAREYSPAFLAEAVLDLASEVICSEGT